MAKTAKEPEGEQQQTAANFLAAGGKKVVKKTKLAVNVDKSQFEKKEIPMSKAAKKTAAPAKAAKGTKPAKAKTARAPRTNGLSEMKIKVLKKEHGAREGTKRFAWLNALIKAKTVGEAQKKVDGLDAGVVRFAVAEGIIKISA